jgi:hypothetical protein
MRGNEVWRASNFNPRPKSLQVTGSEMRGIASIAALSWRETGILAAKAHRGKWRSEKIAGYGHH